MFHDPRNFAFVPRLEAEFRHVLGELEGLGPDVFQPSPDSLTTVRDGYDETGWYYVDLIGGQATEAQRRRCPETLRACDAVPGVLNAGFSQLRPGTHLYPHRGEIEGVLRCHLPLRVPAGDLGIRSGTRTETWQPGRCLIFDDSFEHEAWNRGNGDRVVLLITFRAPA